MQRYATAVPKEMVFRLTTISRAFSSPAASRKDDDAYSGIKFATWH
jgi:hypothetical protein